MMTGAAREKDQADFDLERFIDMFDEALTSQDERVVNALRSLMMMVILTQHESRNPMTDRNAGPLRRMYDDINSINRRLSRVEEESRYNQIRPQAETMGTWPAAEAKYAMKAADVLAKQIDQQIVTAEWTKKINGGLINK
jgi:hypothetical protein